MRKIIFFIVALFLIQLFLLSGVNASSYQCVVGNSWQGGGFNTLSECQAWCTGNTATGFCNVFLDSDSSGSTVKLPNPLTGTNPQQLIGKVINAILGLVGSIALAMFIWGGFTWMTASGNNEKVQKGKDIIIWAVIGLVVIFSAYALVNFVFTSIGV